MQALNPMHQCGRRTRSGGSCQNAAIRGGRVCRMHGGASPRAREAAARRLAALVDPALQVLAQLLEHADSDATKLAACKLVLDYAGLKAIEHVETSGTMTIEVIYGDVEKFDQLDTTTRVPVMESGPEDWTGLARLIRQQPAG